MRNSGKKDNSSRSHSEYMNALMELTPVECEVLELTGKGYCREAEHVDPYRSLALETHQEEINPSRVRSYKGLVERQLL